MSVEKFQNWIIENEGVILSDDTLNMKHLLSKAFDTLLAFGLNKKLQDEILSVFEYENNELKVYKSNWILKETITEKEFINRCRFLEKASSVVDAIFQ